MNTIALTEQQAAHLSQHGRVMVIEPLGAGEVWHSPPRQPGDVVICLPRIVWQEHPGTYSNHAFHFSSRPGDTGLCGGRAIRVSGEAADEPGTFTCALCAKKLEKLSTAATVTSVRAMRLHDVTDEIAQATGVDGGCTECGELSRAAGCGCGAPSPDYRDALIWEWLEPRRASPNDWDSNPVVWVIELEKANA